MVDEITFFTHGPKYRQAVQPIADEARQRGINIRFSANVAEQAEVGVFTEKVYPFHPGPSTELSAFIFHGIDSAYSRGPVRFDWSRFDIGLLHCRAAAEKWKNYSIHPAARPKIGAFSVGWPKADRLTSATFQDEVADYRARYTISDNPVYLYAPTNEADKNMEKFIRSIDSSTNELLIKHGNYDTGKYLEDTSIDALYEKYHDRDGITILDSKDNILFPLAIADVVLSDSYSVLLEGLLTNTVPFTITDWPIKDGKYRDPERTPSYVKAITEEELREFAKSSPPEVENLLQSIQEEREHHFSNIGSSAAVCVDLLENAADGEPLSIEPVSPMSLDSRIQGFRNQIKNATIFTLSAALMKMPDKSREWILENRLHRFLRR